MDVITAIFHNFRPQAALRALLRLQSAVSPRRPHRGARDRERQGYASARMVRSRRLLLGLCLGWQAAACGPSEPGATDKPARSEALTEAEVDEQPGGLPEGGRRLSATPERERRRALHLRSGDQNERMPEACQRER